MMKNYNELVDEIRNSISEDLLVDSKYKIFYNFLKNQEITLHSLTKESIKILWEKCHNEKLDVMEENKIHKFIHSQNYFKISYIKELPHINLTSFSILILSSKKELSLNMWIEFKKDLLNSEISHSELKENDFNLDIDINFESILNKINSESYNNSKKNHRQNQLYILFFLFLLKKGIALIPALFIFSTLSIFSRTISLKRLEYYLDNHFFIKMPYQKHLITKELSLNNKSKYIFYLRFGCIINKNINFLNKLNDFEINSIFELLKSSDKSIKTLYTNFLPLKKILHYHGAINIHFDRQITTDKNSSYEIILNYKEYTKNTILIDAFIKYIGTKNENDHTRDEARKIIAFLKYIDEKNGLMNEEQFINFFKLEFNNNINKFSSKFTNYLESTYAETTQIKVQNIVFISLNNHKETINYFSRENLISFNRKTKNRKIARLAFNKEILDKMKYICLLDPPKDQYYVSTKGFYNLIDSWKHFEISEPQLPIMLFLHLCMPWRSEHLISLDRENFLVKNEKNEITHVCITTDKNQKNDFTIEREFFEYSFNYEYLDIKIDLMKLLVDVIDHCKKTYPNIRPEFRKNNKTWGKITPILCGNNGKGFIKNSIYIGYYYKVLLKALFSMNYTINEIQYFVQLSKSGENYFNEFPTDYKIIENCTSSNISKFFSSEYFAPHSLRKSNITHLLNDGKRLEFILKMSGHSALSTVLRVYIDYDLLYKLNISDSTFNEIKNNFEISSTQDVGKEIIENLKKYHYIEEEDIIKYLKNNQLISSKITLTKELKVTNLKNNNKKLLEPIFWEILSTGICTAAFNCLPYLKNKCSLCPFFYTSKKFFNAINSKIMQITTRIVRYFSIIKKHTFEDNLNDREAILYEEEVKIDLIELQGYFSIIEEFNKQILDLIKKDILKNSNKKLPNLNNISFLQVGHINMSTAQLQIYKLSKINHESNLDVEYSISFLYKKILELIINGDLPRNLFDEHIDNHESVIEKFIALIDQDKNYLNNIKRKFFLE